ncbi:hypothetical protein L9F63_014931, partial [Diploptera punctata]
GCLSHKNLKNFRLGKAKSIANALYVFLTKISFRSIPFIVSELQLIVLLPM